MRIECFDISNLGPTNVVASMVVFRDGNPRKADYRRFKVKELDGKQDDFASMGEVLRRRMAAVPEAEGDLARTTTTTTSRSPRCPD